ncbi:MAG: MBL fold metallo-hydrolase [Prevotellaceae bacterium]|nr:MBL fold metallo-hydrolase [Prevotellaceae bacterium]
MDERLRFRSYGSGSSGNCYYLGNHSHGILIDAGVGIRTIRKYLRSQGFDFPHIWGVFVTHDHADHIKAVGSLGERHHIPIYATRKTHEGIDKSYCVTDKLSGSRKYIEKNDTITVGAFRITPFPVSHDATDSVGYRVEYQDRVIIFATDLGYASQTVAGQIRDANVLILETNYDVQMLADGPYHAVLKRRVAADTGHLSNDQAGECLSENYHAGLQYVFLCHLSKENNHPERAYETVRQCLKNKGIVAGKDVQLVVLERLSPSNVYLF